MKIENYINRIKINRQYAKSTICDYTRTLNKLDQYIKEVSSGKRSLEDTSKLTVEDVEQFIAREKLGGKSARTCNLNLVTIRNFVAYAERNREKVFNYREIVLMKETRRKIDALTENETQRLLYYMRCDRSKDELTMLRDYAIVSVLLSAWLRVSELCDLKVCEIRESLQITGKNNSVRIVYLFHENLAFLRLYLLRRQEQNIHSEYLFCGHSNSGKWKKLSRNSVERMVKQAWVDAWLSTPVWPHKLRHTFATRLLRRWGNIFYIRDLLGHKSISTTQTYLTATNNDLRKTQSLLREPGFQEQGSYDEDLFQMPESIVLKDKSEYDKMMNMFSFWDGVVSRGVPVYWYPY